MHILSVPSFYDLGSREMAVITVYLFCIVEGSLELSINFLGFGIVSAVWRNGVLLKGKLKARIFFNVGRKYSI